MEKVYIIKKIGERFKITDTVDRVYAEEKNLRHLTTICVPFLIDGGKNKKGKWVVHDRYHKLVAKGKASPNIIIKSFNLFGGHNNPPENSAHLIGSYIDEAILFDGLRKELNEEILQKTDKKTNVKKLEVWDKGKNTGEKESAVPYPVPLFAPIPIGFAEYKDKSNTEYSYVFALPLKYNEYKQLIAADDYEIKGKKHDISLPLKYFSENELAAMMNKNAPKVEICDAITRLFLPVNKTTLEKLRKVIN
jgi:hypothetical protein